MKTELEIKELAAQVIRTHQLCALDIFALIKELAPKSCALTVREDKLLKMLEAKGFLINWDSIFRGAIPHHKGCEFDIHFSGEYESHGSKYPFSAWLPLSCIRELTTWTVREIAAMSDYPNMVATGDWSGIRDSSEETRWAIFDRFVLPMVK